MQGAERLPLRRGDRSALAQTAVTDAVRKTPALAQSSVWLTLCSGASIFAQVVYRRPAPDCAMEALLRAVPDVGYVSADFAGGLYSGTVSAGALPGDADGQMRSCRERCRPSSGGQVSEDGILVQL